MLSAVKLARQAAGWPALTWNSILFPSGPVVATRDHRRQLLRRERERDAWGDSADERIGVLRSFQAMTDEEVRAMVRKLAEYYLKGEVTGHACAWLVESLIAVSGIEERDEKMAELAEFVAAYSSDGGEGLHDESELRRYMSGLQ